MKELIKASSWSVFTELIAKVISPVSFLVLTKILSPEDFGVVAVATTFISFVQIITDLGVSKVLIQDQNNDKDYRSSLNDTCFWFNLSIGILIFIFTLFFSNKIALFFGNESSSDVVCVMALQVVFFSLSSIQNANLKKELNFRFLFFTRLITIAMPLFIAIPIALLGGGYWAIVIATVIGAFLNMIILWINSKWRPTFFFDIRILKNILSKSIWNSLDEIIVWIPLGLDAYLIGNYLSSSDLGIYTTSRTLFSAAIAITLGAILPVLYSHFSRIQNNNAEFKNTILFSQKIMYMLAGTMGVGMFLLSDIIESLFFNVEWKGISKVIGIIFLVMSNSYFYSVLQEALRARGYFKDLFKVKFYSMFFIIPILFIVAIKSDIYFYSLIRSLSLYIWIFGVFYYAKKRLDISFYSFFKNSKELIFILFGTMLASFILDFSQEVIPFKQTNLNIILFLIMLGMIIYIEKSLFQKVINLIIKKK
ncbi:MAG: oligosaccharide flippase family protein [Myroides sp.]